MVVEGQRREIAGSLRPSGFSEAAGGEMALRPFAPRLGGKDDIQTAPVRIGRLHKNGDPRLLRNQCGKGHAAKPRLVSL
jgi:hypothetical protein